MTEHTRGRLEIETHNLDWDRGAREMQPVTLLSVDDTEIARVLDNERREANAQHLAACWNLIEDLGGDVEAVREVVELAKHVDYGAPMSVVQKLRDALAKLETSK